MILGMPNTRHHSVDNLVKWFQDVAGLQSQHPALSTEDQCAACGKPSRSSITMMGWLSYYRQSLNEFAETARKDSQRTAFEEIMAELRSYGILDGHAVKLKKWIKLKLEETKQPPSE